jgi:hypothetical protein
VLYRFPIWLPFLSVLAVVRPGWSLPSTNSAINAVPTLSSEQVPPNSARNLLPVETIQADAPRPSDAPPVAPFDLDPTQIESSPTLQRWLKQVPNVLDEIKRDPSFRTRLRLGYAYFPSTDKASGWSVGLEDLLIGRSQLTLSADYQAAFNGQRKAWGTDLRYYVRPLGSQINLAPVIGYRHLETPRSTTDGLNVGLRLLLVPSRTGAADISLTQSWVAPRSDAEVGLTTLSVGYALTRHLRLSTDLQKQNSRQRKDSRVGISIEWMF